MGDFSSKTVAPNLSSFSHVTILGIGSENESRRIEKIFRSKLRVTDTS